MEGKVGPLAEEDARPALDKFLELRLGAQQPQPQVLLFRILVSAAAVLDQIAQRRERGTQADEPAIAVAGGLEAKPLALRRGQELEVIFGARRCFGPGAAQNPFDPEAAPFYGAQLN